MNKELLATAYHEAGHAFIAYLHGRRFKCVSIEPGDDYKGFVEYYDALTVIKILEDTHCNSWLMGHPNEEMKIIERSILSAMAGYIAQDMGVPGSVDSWQWEADRELLGNILIRWDPEHGWNKGEAVVRRELSDNWYLVEGLAKELIERKVLTGKEARSVLGKLKEAYLACIPQLGI